MVQRQLIELDDVQNRALPAPFLYEQIVTLVPGSAPRCYIGP